MPVLGIYGQVIDMFKSSLVSIRLWQRCMNYKQPECCIIENS